MKSQDAALMQQQGNSSVLLMWGQWLRHGSGSREQGEESAVRVTSVKDKEAGAKQSQNGFCHDFAVSSTHSQKADRRADQDVQSVGGGDPF